MALITTNLIYELTASKAKGGTAPGNNTDPTGSWWENVEGVNEGTLTNFAYTTDDGWAGAGTSGDPYHLVAADDASLGYVALAADADISTFASPFTIECWYYLAGYGGSNNYIAGNHSSTGGWSLYISTTGTCMWRMANGSGGYAYPGGTAGTGTSWFHAAVTYDGTSYRAYLNGSASGSAVTAAWGAYSAATAAHLFRSLNATPYMQNGTNPGKIASLRVYSAAFSSTDISTNYAAGPHVSSIDGSLPTLTTKAATNITATTAESGGVITDDGGLAITAKGVCWNTTGSPTTADSKTID